MYRLALVTLIFTFFCTLGGPAPIAAQAQPVAAPAEPRPLGEATGFPMPRFVSLGADPANARTGPGQRYPIRWVYLRRGVPLMVIGEYDTWRQVRDRDGEEGWVHRALLSGTRTAIVTDKDGISLYDKPEQGGQIIAHLGHRVVMRLNKCTLDWCEVERFSQKSGEEFEGWVRRTSLWGLFKDELID